MEELEGLRVAVIFGGRSVEHEVSILTAHQVMAVLEPRHEVIPVYVTREGVWLTSPDLQDLTVYERRAWTKVGRRCWILPEHGSKVLHLSHRWLGKGTTVQVDVAVPAIHGTFGEDGTLQGLLELANIPYTGSDVTASAVGMDKIAMRSAFEAAGLEVPSGLGVSARDLVSMPRTIARIERALIYPVFVKPVASGSSVGVGKAEDADSLALALRHAARFDSQILVEEEAANCIEVNCSVIGDRERTEISVCEQPIAGDSDFLTYSVKYGGGHKSAKTAGLGALSRRIPALIDLVLTEKVRQSADKAFRAVGAEGVARVDCFVHEETGRVLLGEINTIPGSFSWYLWQESGLNFADLMDRLLTLGLERHALKTSRQLAPPRPNSRDSRGSRAGAY